MRHYRVTFKDVGGRTVAAREFDADGDREALSLGKSLLPATIASYEVWGNSGARDQPLIFAEWTFAPRVK
jgi:hypothetical protein